jgi:hypothetical protein
VQRTTLEAARRHPFSPDVAANRRIQPVGGLSPSDHDAGATVTITGAGAGFDRLDPLGDLRQTFACRVGNPAVSHARTIAFCLVCGKKKFRYLIGY